MRGLVLPIPAQLSTTRKMSKISRIAAASEVGLEDNLVRSAAVLLHLQLVLPLDDGGGGVAHGRDGGQHLGALLPTHHHETLLDDGSVVLGAVAPSSV